MKEYLRERQQRERTSSVIGIALAAAVHVLACVLCVFTGFKYLYPPPPETTFLLDFSEQTEEQYRQHFRGIQPQTEEIDRTKPVELVQRSESPHQTTAKNNLTPATRPDDFGDVETPAVEQEKALDPRAAFPGMSKKDTSLSAPHGAREAGATFKPGQPGGNTDAGKAEGMPNAHLEGRGTEGSLPRPSYNVQESGTVVVTIWVDNYGKVVKAQAGADGTTVTDKNLWVAARNAAMGTRFKQKMDAPAMQQGTITYVFKLK